MLTFLREAPWGGKSFVFLVLSVVSGCVVALQFDVNAAFYSTSALDLTVPFGGFWRSLHFYSSQLFFILSCLHVAMIVASANQRLPFSQWLQLIASLVVLLLLLFTGYVLRADVTGEAAGFIAENIALSIPIAGELVNAALFAVSKVGLDRVYANHVIVLAFLWLALSWSHIRRYRLDFAEHGLDVVLLLVFCVFVAAPLEQSGLNPHYIKGPWFFLGMQELLRTMQPFWAGVAFPALLLFSLFLSCKKEVAARAIWFSVVWLVLYGGLSLLAVARG